MLRHKSPRVAWLVIFVFLLSSIASIGLFAPGPSLAYHVNPDDGHGGPTADPAKKTSPTSNKNQPKRNDPVNVAGGNLIHEEVDIYIPGRLFLEMTRKYNCQDMREGPFGFGWTHNYDRSLLRIVEDEKTQVIIRWGDGRRLEFTENEDGTYSPPEGYYHQLSKTSEGYTLVEQSGFKHSFSSSGELRSVKDRNDNQITFAYDGSGRLTRVTGPAGRTLTLTYGENKKISTITDPASRVFHYAYDSKNNLSRFTDPAGNETHYAYDDQHRLTTITDPKGNTALTNTYDSLNRVVSQVSNGGTFSYAYYPDSNYTLETNPRGFQTRIEYNENGNPSRITDRLGNTIIRTWDEKGNLASLRNARGHTTAFAYDEKGNLSSITDPAGNSVTFTYESNYNHLASMANALGHVSTFEYDSKGNMTKATDALGRETTLSYDTNGNLLTVTNAAGNTVESTYNAYGYLLSKKDALHHTAYFTYDALGNLISEKDPNGNTTQYEYDTINQLIKITDAPGNITTYVYDKNGNGISSTDALGNTTAYTYDAYDRLISTTDALGNQTSSTYDENGNLLIFTDAEGNRLTNTYDALDRCVTLTDELGQTTEYAYDPNGNLASIKDANGNTTTYTYDSLNRLTRTTYPDGSTTSHTYDVLGNNLTATDQKGQTITYAYDDLNRLITKTFPDTTQVTYTYNVLNRLTSVSSSDSALSYAYDAGNRLTQATQDGKSISYEYDAVGNTTKCTYPDASYVTSTYNSVNRIHQLKDSAGNAIAAYTYDALGRKTKLQLYNGTEAHYQYDETERLIRLTHKVSATGSVISEFAYTFDKAGNIISGTSRNGTHQYTYDDIYQLAQVDYPDASPVSDKTYTYDHVGNRTSTVNGGTVNYTVSNMNRYTGVGAAAYSYDANGNLISDKLNTYGYDYENRLIQINSPSHTSTYKYDPFGRRISKTVDGTTKTFIYDEEHVVEEIDSSGQVTHYIYGPQIDEILSMIKPDTTKYYYHGDSLGSVSTITDAAGLIKESYDYDVYGKRHLKDASGNPIEQSLIGNPYMFTARKFDNESGLYYFRARYYDAAIGRFLQVDPISSAILPVNYLYAWNNPINWIDPYGLWSWRSFGRGALKAAGVAVAGAAVGVVIVLAAPAAATSVASSAVLMTVGKGMAVVAAAGLGWETGQIYTGQDITLWNKKGFLQTRKMSEHEQSERAGVAAVGWVLLGGAYGASKIPQKGTTVIGHLPDYPKVAQKMGARYLKPSSSWTFQKQGKFIRETIARGDDVFIGSKIRQGTSVLRREIKQLIKAGYRPKSPGSKWLIKD